LLNDEFEVVALGFFANCHHFGRDHDGRVSRENHVLSLWPQAAIFGYRPFKDDFSSVSGVTGYLERKKNRFHTVFRYRSAIMNSVLRPEQSKGWQESDAAKVACLG
jgi:hypothetical protein